MVNDVLCCSLACILDELVELRVVLGEKIVRNFHLEEVACNLIAGGIGLIIDVIVCVSEVTIKSGKSFGNRVVAGNFFAEPATVLCVVCENAMGRFALSLIENTVVGDRLSGNVI